MAQINARAWLRNTAGRIWIEALDGPRPDGGPPPEDTLRQALSDVGAAPPPEDAPPAAAPSSLRARLAGAALVVGALAVLVAAILLRPAQPTAAPAAAPRSAPTAALPTAQPSLTAQPARMIVAYWAPGGEAVPEPIREMDAHHFVGRQGSGWAQSLLPGGGLVWVRRSDLHPDPVDLEALARVPDLTPPTPAPVVQVPVAAPEPRTPNPEPQQAAAPTPSPLAVPPMRFPADAPAELPGQRRVGEKPVSKRPPPGTRAYGLASPLQPPAWASQPRFGDGPTEAPVPAKEE